MRTPVSVDDETHALDRTNAGSAIRVRTARKPLGSARAAEAPPLLPHRARLEPSACSRRRRRSTADEVVVDLEDGVAAADKDARAANLGAAHARAARSPSGSTAFARRGGATISRRSRERRPTSSSSRRSSRRRRRRRRRAPADGRRRSRCRSRRRAGSSRSSGSPRSARRSRRSSSARATSPPRSACRC